MEKIIESIQRAFPSGDVPELTPCTRLGELPDWDSMTSITLLLQIEKVTGKKVRDFRLGSEMSLQDLADKVSNLSK